MIQSISYPYPLPPYTTFPMHMAVHVFSHPPSPSMESYAGSKGAGYERGDNTDVYKD